jgi:PilZ domain
MSFFSCSSNWAVRIYGGVGTAWPEFLKYSYSVRTMPMTGAEKIQDKKLSRLMDRLLQEKTMLSMRLVGQDYQRLTMITRILKDTNTSFFTIDPPRDFKAAVTNSGTWEIHFNFRGPDNLEYIFVTFGGNFFDDETRIPFPKYIERLQRRKHFRLSVPAGTRLYFELEQIRRGIDLMNISLRGALGFLSRSSGRDQKKPILKKEDHLENIEIIFPPDISQSGQKLNVNKVSVRRAEHDPERRIDIYAFEFESIDKDQEKKLSEIIFNLQRLFLRRK